MKASVIICTYNRAESLRTALQCLEWQTYDDFEVIVVNGPSTDNTECILSEYEGKIKVLYNLHKNYIISRNMGANAASGDILCYIDDDCEPDTPWLANVVHEFGDARVGAVTGPVYDTNAPNGLYSAWICDSNVQTECISKFFPHHSSSQSFSFPYTHGCNMSVRRSAMEKIGGFIEDFVFYYDEPELCNRLVVSGYTIVNVASCAITHNSISGMNDKKMRDKNKGLLRPYHYLKNAIYLYFAWRQPDESLECRKSGAENIVASVLNDGKSRFENGILTYEEWCHYKEGIAPALEWGLKHGMAADLEAASITSCDSSTFLPFVKRRKDDAMVLCLLSWSLVDDSGGTGQAYSLLARNLAQRGHEVHVMAPASGKPFCSFFDHVHWHHLQCDCNITIEDAPHATELVQNCSMFYSAIEKLSQRRVVDACMGFIFTSPTLFIAQDVSFNAVLTLCTTHKTWCKTHPHWKGKDSILIEKIEELAVKSHKYIHTISKFIEHGVKSDYPDSMREDAVVFDVPLGTQCTQPVTERIPSGRIRILFVSRLEGRKCPDVLLAAFAKIAPKYKCVELVMAGNDTLSTPTGRTYRQNFEAQYMGTDIGSRVHFLGFISEEEKWKHYHECDIFCMPSFSESFGIPFIEAMACGKPVIGCRAGGMPEVIEEGKTGLLAEPGDVATLAACLEELITDEAKRERMGKSARLRYEQNYTSELYTEKMEKELYRIAGKRIRI